MKKKCESYLSGYALYFQKIMALENVQFFFEILPVFLETYSVFLNSPADSEVVSSLISFILFLENPIRYGKNPFLKFLLFFFHESYQLHLILRVQSQNQGVEVFLHKMLFACFIRKVNGFRNSQFLL